MRRVLVQQKIKRIIIIITNTAVTWKGAGLMTVLGHKSGVRNEYVLFRAL